MALLAQENSIFENRYLLDFLSNENLDSKAIITEIEGLAANPVYIGELVDFDFQKIPLVNFEEASILEQFVQSGKILSRHELLEIDNIPYEKLLYIIHFFTDTLPLKRGDNFLSTTNAHLRGRIYRYDFTESFSETRQYNRLMVNGKHFGFIFLVDRLPEQSEYFRFNSVGLKLTDIGILNHAVLGKYKFRFGKGLVINNSFPTFKDMNTLNRYFGSQSTTLKSIEENVQLEGFSTSVKLNDSFTIDAFYSNKMIYVKKSEDMLYFSDQYTHLRGSYHNLADRVKEIIYGGVLESKLNKNISLSVLYASIQYSSPITYLMGTFSNIPYLSAGGEYKSKRVAFNFEMSFSRQEYAGAITSEISPYKHLSFYVGYRIFSPDWYSPYGNSVAEFNGRNEQGIYFGSKYSSPFGIFYIFYDKYSRIEFRSLTNLDESGDEYTFQYYSPRFGNARINTKLTYELKGEPTDDSIFRTSISGVLDMNENFSAKLTGKTSNYSNKISSPGTSAGWFIEQVNIFSPEFPIKIILSSYIFDLQDYESRIYLYSYGVPGSYNILSQTGKGYGYNILLQYRLINTLELSINYRSIRKSYNDEKSSDSQLAFQFDLML